MKLKHLMKQYLTFSNGIKAKFPEKVPVKRVRKNLLINFFSRFFSNKFFQWKWKSDMTKLHPATLETKKLNFWNQIWQTKTCNDPNFSYLIMITIITLILTIPNMKHPNRERLITTMYSIFVIASYIWNRAH